MRASDLKHVPRRYRRANKWSVALTPGVGDVTVNEIGIVELRDRVRGDERRRTIRILKLSDQAFRGSSKE